jgi:hypothetical protein
MIIYNTACHNIAYDGASIEWKNNQNKVFRMLPVFEYLLLDEHLIISMKLSGMNSEFYF